MKLLRNFPRLCIAGFRAVSGRRMPAARGFHVTVPAPLARPVIDSAVVVDLHHAAQMRMAASRQERPVAMGQVTPQRMGVAR